MTEAREQAQRREQWHTTDERIAQLEGQVDALVQAVHALIDGLEPEPVVHTEEDDRAARGARLARELLLTKGL
ncbi:hypothetical protein [Streptomyces sp. 6N223]|uniref:hypothetical protein n=1 Tax=Streptomyces sp. 6N223 TaxID=3457412 RepID=UPI003FD3EF14